MEAALHGWRARSWSCAQRPGPRSRRLIWRAERLSEGSQVELAGLGRRSLCGRSPGVADQHVGAGPAGHGHQPGLRAARCEPAVGCGVAELVRVEAVDAREGGAAAQRLAEAVVPEPGPPSSQPQGWIFRRRMLLPQVEVVADRPDGGGADGDGPASATLAEADSDAPGGQVEVVGS